MTEAHQPGDRREGPRLGVGTIATLAAVVLLLVFMVQNTEDVTLDVLFWSFTWPVWLLSVLMAGLGAVILFGAGVVRRRGRRADRRE